MVHKTNSTNDDHDEALNYNRQVSAYSELLGDACNYVKSKLMLRSYADERQIFADQTSRRNNEEIMNHPNY